MSEAKDVTSAMPEEIPADIRTACETYYFYDLMPLYENKGVTLTAQDIIESWHTYQSKPTSTNTLSRAVRTGANLNHLWQIAGELIHDDSSNTNNQFSSNMMDLIATHRQHVFDLIEQAMIAEKEAPPGYIAVPKKYNPIRDPAPPVMFRIKRVLH